MKWKSNIVINLKKLNRGKIYFGAYIHEAHLNLCKGRCIPCIHHGSSQVNNTINRVVDYEVI